MGTNAYVKIYIGVQNCWAYVVLNVYGNIRNNVTI
jgi:hypothetical protein